jgi:hypothetical protein
MKATLKAELESAFRNVLTGMPSQFTTQEAVETLKEQYPELWQESGDALVTEILREMASRILRRPDATEVNPDQLRLPGFESLPRLIRFKGAYITIEESNLEQLEHFKRWYDARLQILLKRTEKFQETGKQLARLIRLVARYAASYPAITVQGVFALRAITEPQRAARMRNLGPDERAAIAKMGADAKWRTEGED